MSISFGDFWIPPQTLKFWLVQTFLKAVVTPATSAPFLLPLNLPILSLDDTVMNSPLLEQLPFVHYPACPKHGHSYYLNIGLLLRITIILWETEYWSFISYEPQFPVTKTRRGLLVSTWNISFCLLRFISEPVDYCSLIQVNRSLAELQLRYPLVVSSSPIEPLHWWGWSASFCCWESLGSTIGCRAPGETGNMNEYPHPHDASWKHKFRAWMILWRRKVFFSPHHTAKNYFRVSKNLLFMEFFCKFFKIFSLISSHLFRKVFTCSWQIFFRSLQAKKYWFVFTCF